MKKTVLFMERYSQAGQRIRETLERAGYDCCAIVLEDDGFLPDRGVISPYAYYIRERDRNPHDEKRLHYAFLDIPEFWEIRPFIVRSLRGHCSGWNGRWRTAGSIRSTIMINMD